MKITVKIFQGDQVLETKVFSEGSFRVGRSEFCDIVLSGDSVSRSHVEIRVTPTTVYMTNMSGAGRIKLNGERVETGEVKDGDTIALGPYKLVVFHSEFPADSSPPEEPAVPEPEPEAEPNPEPSPEPLAPALSEKSPALEPLPFGSASAEDYPVEGTAALVRAETIIEPKPLVAKLVFTDGPRKGEELLLEAYEVTMGRSRKIDIFLDDEKLSRQHAKIARMGMGYRLIDLNSRNGTFVNGMRILEHPLNSFDVIELGSSKIKFLIHDIGMQEANKGGLTLVKNPAEQTRSLQMDTEVKDEMMKLQDHARMSSAPLPGYSEAKGNKRAKIYGGAFILLLIIYFLTPSEDQSSLKPDEAVAPKASTAVAQQKGAEGTALMPALPKEYNDLTADMQRKIEGYYNTSMRMADRKDYEQAILQVRKIHETLPYYKNSRDLLDTYSKRLKETQADKAKEKANQAVQDLQIYLDDGVSYLKEGDFDRATEAFRQALNIDPRNETAIKGLKAAEYKVKSFEEIPPERDPEEDKVSSVRELFEKAIAAFKSKSYQEAIDSAEKIRLIELKNNTQYLNEAKQIIDRAKMLQKEEFEPFLIQAKEKYAEGDYNSARDLCEEMLKRDPSYEDAKDLLAKTKKQLNKLAKEAYTTGYILESMNRIEEAKQYWNRSKNYVRPGDEYHNKVMKKLDQYQ
jgi:pSer/pThr/pTyr-binding forkhead associated (FHA) protein/tetratricopeptide (TPR) repeat protein